LNSKYTEDQFVNTAKSHKSYQPKTNSKLKVTAKVAEELNQSNENSDTQKEDIQHITAKLGGFLKKMGKPNNAWLEY
jgi:bisphosphoglycerate-dependent phosphoglycerate mutase